MPLFYQQDINEHTRLAIWEIKETEAFFIKKVPLQQQITHPHKRLQHLAGRYLLPLLFADFPHKEIEIANTRKPFLPGEQYHFSISHCSRFAAAIVSSHNRIGIDVEIITTKLEKIKQKFLHPDELRFVNAQPPNARLKLLTILWSAKEAIYKWYGSGEVNFKEMIRTYPFQLQTEGEVVAAFIKNDLQQKLLLYYKIMDDMTLVWVMS